MASFSLGFLSAAPLMLILGPVAVLLLDTGMSRGFRWGWPAAAGVVTADATLAAVASVAHEAMAPWLDSVSSFAPVASGVTLAGVGAWLLVPQKVATTADAPPTVPPGDGDRFRLARTFWAFTAVNPLTILAFGALLIAAGPSASGAGWPLGVALASLIVHFSLVATGASVRSWIGPRTMARMRVAAGVAVIATAVVALV